MASRTINAGDPIAASPLKWVTFVGVFLVVCLLNFLVSNLPTFLDLGVVTIATIGGVIFGRKSTEWY